MTSWIISPPQETEWRLDRRVLVEALVRDWPGVVVSGPDPELSTENVRWAIRDEMGDLVGSQDQQGTGQYLDGPIELVARHAAWLRNIVPAEVELVLYDDTYSTAATLTPGMSSEQVILALSPT